MLRYRNAGLQCTFTTYQAAHEPTGETGDEATTALVMASEIEAVKTAAGKPVDEVADRAASLYLLEDRSGPVLLDPWGRITSENNRRS
ncbi:hypothetical protein NIBR502772_19370 [Pseudarthrobacter sp. NIBRBAC000502772]|uniref:hypothetical protein n=1 Tax=Pseudarthrobacter sp. NIBRBAC000502772 TaxID=2590775 RepID=UPI0011309B62|nr:hypothetical protein [Pseudarthrobacter sp. NIBRBAC000502772]QDG68078.1 hypothetical protein NIBR502772_19370 [Pseudarthrobacter sp. NIBRBAC000502772]